MAENLCTWHELIIKAYDEVWWELLYSWGFITEPNDTVEDFLLENNIILSNAATAEVECALTWDLWTMSWTRKAQTFNQILSTISVVWRCTSEWEDVEWDATEVPATLVMSIYGVLNKENNQHGAIFTWHSVRDEDYSAMRGPCPEGFHVPYNTEFTTLYNILDNIWALTEWREWTDFRNYLKIPSSYRYINNNWNYVDAATTFWCNAKSTSSFATTWLQIDARTVRQNVSLYKSYWTFIRPFKDTPVAPDNNRTVLYDGSSTATWAWVFWNNTLWLISVSWDWNTRYTISDKNLWATRVYNTWDTASESNCWWYFQYWNNHMFPFNWTITTSSTQVDTTGYWPENPYSSSTFIIRASSPYDWSSITNNNLRWWATWVKSWYKLLHKEHYIDYSAMRGPCPGGYHLATMEECELFRDFLNTFEKTPSELAAYLKIPKCWNLSRNSWNRSNSWSQSINHCAETILMWTFSAASFIYNPNSQQWSEWGFVRPIADVPVIPDASWTTIFDWSQSYPDSWIFWNPSLELISISDNWTRRLTMADKNLWATVVYDWGSTYNQNNSGNAFQRWNCHPFPFSWAWWNTSPDRVDTTWYWPNNYYSSDTFITDNTSRQITYNPNLRWWVTWAVERGRRVI